MLREVATIKKDDTRKGVYRQTRGIIADYEGARRGLSWYSG